MGVAILKRILSIINAVDNNFTSSNRVYELIFFKLCPTIIIGSLVIYCHAVINIHFNSLYSFTIIINDSD